MHILKTRGACLTGGVSSEEVFEGLLLLEDGSVANGAMPPRLVLGLDTLVVILGHFQRRRRVLFTAHPRGRKTEIQNREAGAVGGRVRRVL